MGVHCINVYFLICYDSGLETESYYAIQAGLEVAMEIRLALNS